VSKPHLITVSLTPAEARELHVAALCAEVKQPIQRFVTALGFQSVMRGGQQRVVDVTECPQCGATAPDGRPDLVPWVAGSREIHCTGGCVITPRQLAEIYDGVLEKIQAGRPTLSRYYALRLQINTPAEGEEPKWRAAIGADLLATLDRLEPLGDSIVRAVAVDAIDLVTAQAAIRNPATEIPWHPRLPLNFRGELMDTGWHGAQLTPAERELMRRRRVAV
jgi:hypothetical protein